MNPIVAGVEILMLIAAGLIVLYLVEFMIWVVLVCFFQIGRYTVGRPIGAGWRAAQRWSASKPEVRSDVERIRQMHLDAMRTSAFLDEEAERAFERMRREAERHRSA